MAEIRHVAVIDIGKSNAKLALVDLETAREIDLRKIPNKPLGEDPYPHHDTETLWNFVLDSLSALGQEHAIDAVTVTTHGATAALVDGNGELVLPVLDYECPGPDSLREEYRPVRPSFSETGSPDLPLGLNLGAQLFWQETTFSDAFKKALTILTYPQYWAFRLTGVLASEATSLGCHTDLWNPQDQRFSSLVEKIGWKSLFPPLRRAHEELGPLLPGIARRTGLSPSTPVFCGIHDSNASLLPHLLSRKPPFTVISTGTWVVAMAIGGQTPSLDPARDTLINVDAHGKPVPSARFMGGREYEMLVGEQQGDHTEQDAASVLADGIMLLPSVQGGCGPFPDAKSRWIAPRDIAPGERVVASAFYLALMTATCLDLIGSAGEIIVEGPFATNSLFIEMLSAVTQRPVLPQSGNATGTSIGAAFLAGSSGKTITATDGPRIVHDETWRAYGRLWREEVTPV